MGEDAAALERVRRYYESTLFDYRAFWVNRGNPALHFGFWDEGTRSHADSLVNVNRVLAERARIRPGQRVLDAGCGLGGTSIWLARERQAEVVGITVVADQVRRATRRSSALGLSGSVLFEERDFTRTGLPDASFDVVWAQESVCHALDKRAFLAESHRLLRPGGRLVMAEYMRQSRPNDQSEERLMRSWLSGWAIPDLATGEEFQRWSAEVGFADVELEDCTPRVRRSHRRLHVMAALSYPGESLLNSIGLRSDVQHGNLRAARDQWRAFRRGLWFEGLLSARKP